MIIYIGPDYKCSVTESVDTIAIETDFFDGKCTEFIEGYRFVPSGMAWIRSDGEVFTGEMISPWKDYKYLAAAQAQYEKDLELLSSYQEELSILYGEDV